LDCCNAGGIAREVGIKDGATEVRALGIESDTFDIIMASGFLEAAFEVESLRGGFLTHGILEALGDRFFEADFDKDRAISFQDLTLWLEKRADQLNTHRAASEQIPRPARLGYGTGISYLTRLPDESVIHEFGLPNATRTVLLPTYPQTARGFEYVVSMATHPVTNAQYRKFVEATAHDEPVGKTYSKEMRWHGQFRPWRDQSFCEDDQPVVCIDVRDALYYCEWLKMQCDRELVRAIMLPSERLWNVAAFRKGTWSYPPKDFQSEVHQLSDAPAPCVNVPERTSRLGLTDLFGNVWEWGGTEAEWGTEILGPERYSGPELYDDFYADLRHRVFSIVASPPNPHVRQIRGGSFLDNIESLEGHIRTTDLADRDETRHTDLGFRVVAILHKTAIAPDILEKLLEYYPLYGREVSVWP
jgi:formylglycine-generating enzyme required for sulfatase activity